MKTPLVLVAAGVGALAAAVAGYAFGAAQLGTAAATTALLVTGAGLALLNQAARAGADQQRTETNSVSISH
jgi:threonine dehydratase